MSIRIQKRKCTGCGRCIEACPGNLIKKDKENKAFIRQVRDCWGCTSCIKECPVYAINFFLGADIGGMGSNVHTEKEGDILHWIINKPDGKTINIDINQKESNKY